MDLITLKAECSLFRTQIKDIGKAVIDVRDQVISTAPEPTEDRGEIVANIMLAYRHLEDAAMRLGKTIQASEDGISIYDQNDAERVAGINK